MRGRSLDYDYNGIPTPRSMTTSPDSVTEQSVCYSLKQLDINSRVLYGNSTFSFLPTILSEAGPDSCVYAAMRSVGAINFANRSPTVDLHSIVDLEYARAVSSVTNALADPLQCLKDETLVAVWLLAMREVLLILTSHRARLTESSRCWLVLLDPHGRGQMVRLGITPMLMAL
jgi:hypothetical protein